MFRFSHSTGRVVGWAAGAMLLAACSVTDQAAERAAPTAVPTEVRTDADRRAIYNSNGAPSSNGYPVPDATPNRVRLGDQAADINRQKRIENLNTDAPNNKPPEARIEQLKYDAPLPPDTSGIR